MFEIVDVSQWGTDEVDEPLGTKQKHWMQGHQWLFKEVRTPGEDWAEKVVEQLGLLLGLPIAHVELATHHGARGIISESFVPADARLEHGNELLVRIDPDYDRDQTRRNERYTVEAVKEALADADPPAGADLPNLSAFDVWAGYLLLDAWVAGRDRHHENWAVIATPDSRTLAPSFDHGNALGCQEPEDAYRHLAADQVRLMKWADRGRSHHFAGRPRLTDLARDALARSAGHAAETWMTALAAVREDDVAAVMSQVPVRLMSEVARKFCIHLLMLNQRRMCDGDYSRS